MLRIKRWVRTDFGSHKFRQTKSSNWRNSAINTRSLQKRISLHIILFNFHNSVNCHFRDEENEANHSLVKRDWASVYWTTPQSDLPPPAAHTLLWDTVPSPTAFHTLPLTELSFLMHLPYSSTANPEVNTTPYPYFARVHGSLPTAQAVIRMWAKCYPGEGQATTGTQREHLTSLRGSEKTPEVPFTPDLKICRNASETKGPTLSDSSSSLPLGRTTPALPNWALPLTWLQRYVQMALHSSELQTWTLKTASWPPALECLSDPPSSHFKINFPSPTCWSVNNFATIPCLWQLQAMLTPTINQGNSMWSQGRRHTVRGKLTISVWTQGNQVCPQIHLGVWSLKSLLFTHHANQFSAILSVHSQG